MFENPTEATNPSGIKIKLAIGLIISVLLIATIILAFFSAQSATRDRIRLKDIALIQNFLEAYKISTGVYPSANGMNQPMGWEKYLQILPQAPVPPDGACTHENNQYRYTTQNQRQEYQMTFCLGDSIQEYSAGLNSVKNP